MSRLQAIHLKSQIGGQKWAPKTMTFAIKTLLDAREPSRCFDSAHYFRTDLARQIQQNLRLSVFTKDLNESFEVVLLGAALDEAANEKPELGRGLSATFHHAIVGREGHLYGQLHCWHLLITEVAMLPEIYRPKRVRREFKSASLKVKGRAVP